MFRKKDKDSKRKASSELRLEDSYAYWIYIAARLLRKNFMQIARGRGFDLYPEQWFIINKLYRRPGQSQVELSNSVFEDRPSITRTLATLEKRGWVKKSVDPTDSRKYRVFLTPEGRAVHDDFAQVILSTRERLFKDLSEKDFEQFMGTLNTLIENLEAEENSKSE